MLVYCTLDLKENGFEHVVYKMSANLFRLQYVENWKHVEALINGQHYWLIVA